MDNKLNSSSLQKFDKAYIKEAGLASERALTSDILTGTITLPVYMQTIMGEHGGKGDVATICTIPFHLENNFSFSLGNNWKPLVDTSLFEDFNYLINGIQLATSNQGQAQLSFASKQMQLAMWSGSEQPKFSIDMTFVCTDRYYNPVNIILAICEAALPRDFTESKNGEVVKTRDGIAKGVENMGSTFGGFADKISGSSDKNNRSAVGQNIELMGKTIADGIRNSGLMAPLFYGAKFENGQAIASNECTLTLQIGRWFRADKLIVESISNIEFSKEVIAPPTGFLNNGQSDYRFPTESKKWGFPLYAKCTMTLRPITYITAEDFIKYFIAEPSDKGAKADIS